MPGAKNSDVYRFLSRFHENTDIDAVFTCGCCYWFALTLHLRFKKNSKIMYDQVANHFVTKIDGRLFDITGDVTDKYNAIPWNELSDDLLRKRVIRDCIMF